MDETQEQALGRLLEVLRAGDSAARLTAMHELDSLGYSSPAILQELERISVNEDDPALRTLAARLLDNPVHRFIRGRLASLPRSTRQVLLQEIGAWEKQGILRADQAALLRKRYDFDIAAPAVPGRKPAQSPPPAAPRAQPPSAAAANPTLTERLLSQSSINVFLYLGAFLVIGAGLILAAVVQAARLPILSGVTFIFGAGAVALKKRLPQPSFALFIVFSFMLPILANVAADSLGFSGRAAEAYWSAVLFAMSIIWGFSTWFYGSRLFSVASLLSTTLAFIRFAGVLDASADWSIFSAGLAALAGLAGVRLVKGWRGGKFAVPLFIAAQGIQGLILLASLGSLLAHSFDARVLASDWSAITLTWLGAACFFALSGLLFPWGLLAWASAACLLPLSWLLLNVFEAGALAQVTGLWLWASILAATSETLAKSGPLQARKFSLPLLLASLPVFVAAAVWGLVEGSRYGFLCLAGTAAVYAILHALRPRGLVWAAALVSGLGAYFTLFTLPFMARLDVDLAYRFLGASLLLLLPELFFLQPLTSQMSWRWPPFTLGLLVSLAGAIVTLSAGDAGRSSIVFGIDALLAAAYALHLRRPRLGYLATACAALAVCFALLHFDSDAWLPVLSGLAGAYFLAGFILRSTKPGRPWGAMLRASALGLGMIVSLASLAVREASAGWYVAGIGALFVIETFLREGGPLEAGGPFLFSIAAFEILRAQGIHELVYYLLATSLVWLAGDAIYARTLPVRSWSRLTRAAAALLTGANLLALLAPAQEPGPAAFCLGVYALFFTLDAWLYRQVWFGYAAAACLPLSVFFALREWQQPDWLYPMAAIAAAYYAAGYLIRRRGGAQEWARMLLLCGLALGGLNALSAPLRPGLAGAIPVTLGAALFTIEAFARRNVWLAFPANLLYLEAYFLILAWLRVDEPQFFSVAAAIVGMLMHYLLTRAGSRAGAFITGMLSQLILLGTTYIQFLGTGGLGTFALLFFQGLAVLGYGMIARSRSLVVAPIAFIVLSVITLAYGALKGLSAVFLVGCSGMLLLLLGILAVVLRERLSKIGERFSDWRA
jgi:hypothetical protein